MSGYSMVHVALTLASPHCNFRHGTTYQYWVGNSTISFKVFYTETASWYKMNLNISLPGHLHIKAVCYLSAKYSKLTLQNLIKASLRVAGSTVNQPSNAEATFVQITRARRFLKIISTLSAWCSLDSSHWVLSDEYPCARVSVFFIYI